MSSASTTSPEQDAVLRASIDRSLRHPVMFFFTSGAAWLAVSILLGLVSSIKMHSPNFLGEVSWLTYGRVFPAHLNALVYGWGCQAAFGAVIWLMSRLSRQECRAAGTILVAGHVWNLAVSLGVIAILAGGSTGMPWMEMPGFAWVPMLLAYAGICVWSIIQFRVRPEGHVFISQWYLLAALIWFPWVFTTANFLLRGFDGSPVMAVGVNAWFRSGMVLLFFAPVAIASAYYLVPKVTGKPVHSYTLSLLGFWSLAVIAPWAGMQKLAGAPIPNFIPYLGAAAAVMFALPAVSVGFNLLKTASTAPDTVVNSPSLRFGVAGIIGMMVYGFAGCLVNLPSVLPKAQFSLTGYGMDILAIYGFFSLIAFGLIYFVVPRVTCREWLSSRLIKMHFFFSIYGLVTVVVGTVLGGLIQGIGQEDFLTAWESSSARSYPYSVATTISWSFILFSNVFFFLHLTLMWLRLGRRSTHPTLLGHPHHSDLHDATHGPEGEIDNAGSTAAHSH